MPGAVPATARRNVAQESARASGSEQRSYGDQRAREAAEGLRDHMSEQPVHDGVSSAFTGRREALERLQNEGLPSVTNALDGFQALLDDVGFVANGGLNELGAGDVVSVATGAALDAYESVRVIEAIQNAPKAARDVYAAGTVSGEGMAEIRDAAEDLASNKATELGATVATGVAVGAVLSTAATVVPPVGPLAVVKAGLYGASIAWQVAGTAHVMQELGVYADKRNEMQTQHPHTSAAIDEIRQRDSRRAATAPASTSKKVSFGRGQPDYDDYDPGDHYGS